MRFRPGQGAFYREHIQPNTSVSAIARHELPALRVYPCQVSLYRNIRETRGDVNCFGEILRFPCFCRRLLEKAINAFRGNSHLFRFS